MNRAQRRAAGVRENEDVAFCRKMGVGLDQRVWLVVGIRVEHTMDLKVLECSGREARTRSMAMLRDYTQEPHLFTEPPNKADPNSWVVRLLRLLEEKGWGYDTNLSPTEPG